MKKKMKGSTMNCNILLLKATAIAALLMIGVALSFFPVVSAFDLEMHTKMNMKMKRVKTKR